MGEEGRMAIFRNLPPQRYWLEGNQVGVEQVLQTLLLRQVQPLKTTHTLQIWSQVGASQSELCHSHGQPWREPIATAWTDSLLKVTGSLKVQKSSPHPAPQKVMAWRSTLQAEK